MTIEELKSKIEKAEKSLSSPMLQSNPSILESVKKNIENYKKQLAELENKAEKKVEDAEKKAEDAETKVEKKEAAKEVQKAKEEVKKVEEVKEKVEEVKEKVEVKIRPKASEGTARKKMPKKASSPKKMVVPKNARMDKLAISKRKMKAAKSKAPVKSAVVKATSKKARAFGQVIEYKNDVEFCAKLKAAFKKRRAAAKSTSGKRRKTKPVFGVITNSVKNAVSKALHNVPTKEIEKNPKQFLAKAERLEKSAMRFLEDFKSILGNDYKKSSITSEFGELEKAIKQFVAKIAK
jgi:hypothetical protein